IGGILLEDQRNEVFVINLWNLSGENAVCIARRDHAVDKYRLKDSASMFPPHTTIPTVFPSSRVRSGYINAASAAPPAGSVTSFADLNNSLIASRIRSSLTSTT